MSWIDIFPILLLIVYGVGGFFTRLIRRLIGLAALFVASWAATNMGLQAGGILQQTSNFPEASDAKIYGFFGIIVALLVIVEVATQLAHSNLQLPAIVLDRTLGVIVGVITAVLMATVVTYELDAAANPIGGVQLDGLQQSLRDSVHGSFYMVGFVNSVGKPIITLFSPLLPSDPQIYFGPGPVS
ncbi:MAG TPA: CvpA family protein [Candidatus Dormibacteraeota bacterium]|nr:CvpA family protein [Candidatus Dormibacteraeota bacterium]